MQLKRTSFAFARLGAALAFAGVSVTSGTARAQVAQVDIRNTVFYEPSKKSHLFVDTPAATVAAQPTDWLDVHAGYEADIVTGATEAIKSGPLADVVTAATHFSDTRHQFRGGAAITRKEAHVSADYSYGTESDYHSQSFAISAGSDFLQKNTQIELQYARGFDHVCTTNYQPSTAPSGRTRLDSSARCFTKSPDRASRAIDLDTFQVGWTQAWTPLFATQMVLSGGLQHGFLGNPYRSVVIAPNGQDALENHPENRARGALSLRAKYFIKPITAAATVGARFYRDTWDILGETVELEFEKYLTPALRLLVHGRYYHQTEALFWSDDYTGGEPVTGPRGEYWSGDRELSPLWSWMAGGRVLFGAQGAPGARVLGALLRLQGTASFDLLSTHLQNFTWNGAAPDDTTAMLVSVGVRGEF
ncbi:MAG TPA: DUF3570 domain-containing protein [Polyangiaceae bacterium]|nr:DUF3570 domain-containing protein [Polyangiaceae bacterium]